MNINLHLTVVSTGQVLSKPSENEGKTAGVMDLQRNEEPRGKLYPWTFLWQN